ncbi:MAG: MamI family restriction endonuclease [Thermodesulfovibrionales bacterium]|nr:MamI family restriction endonuclease [Thermodesulfovibrionales bacterium]
MPKNKFITIFDNKTKIKNLLYDLVLSPRIKALEWSNITKQTPSIKIGYPGQHLASLITGIEGARTGARGDDLKDGSEVKSCSRIDQLDTCNKCEQKVLRIETKCSHCGSADIKRMDDSKWLFSVKSESELKLLTETVDRILLTIGDYPNFASCDFSTLRFQAFEIWNDSGRHINFKTIMSNYFYKIFIEHIKRNPNKTPAPKNFWPYSYQFYLCNPVRVFSCIVENANTNPSIHIDHYVEPDFDRNNLTVEKMPTELLGMEELTLLIKVPQQNMLSQISKGYSYSDFNNICRGSKLDKKALLKVLPFIDEDTRRYLPLRDTDKISEAKIPYTRRK